MFNFQKFVRRHTGTVLFDAVLTAFFVAGVATAVWGGIFAVSFPMFIVGVLIILATAVVAAN